MSATTPGQIRQSAKAIVSFIFLTAAAIVAYPDLLPLHGNVKASVTTACVLIGAIAVYFKKNAGTVESDAAKIQLVLKGLGVTTPNLTSWADDALIVLGAIPDPTAVEVAPVVPAEAPVVVPVTVVVDKPVAEPTETAPEAPEAAQDVPADLPEPVDPLVDSEPVVEPAADDTQTDQETPAEPVDPLV
jgi:hypothetical protein